MYEITTIEGNEAELADRRARLDMERRQVALRGLSWDEEDRERDRLKAEYAALDREKIIPVRRELTPTGETEGQYWQRLTMSERARYLRRGEFIAEFGRAGEMDRTDGTRDGFGMELVYVDVEEAAG